MYAPRLDKNKTGYYDDNQTADIDTKNYYDTQWPLTVSTWFQSQHLQSQQKLFRILHKKKQ